MEIRGRVNKANNLMQYLSNITRGVEVNTALLLYKSIGRSVMDYDLFIYSPLSENIQLLLEIGQFLDIRMALGYRKSTPTNVLIAESKLTFLRDRAVMHAKKFCAKVYKYGENAFRDSLDNLKNKEMIARYRNPLFHKSVLCEAWEYTCRFRSRLGNRETTFEIWKMDYKCLTEKIAVDCEIGISVKKRGIKIKTDLHKFDYMYAIFWKFFRNIANAMLHMICFKHITKVVHLLYFFFNITEHINVTTNFFIFQNDFRNIANTML
ncbi:hypothetical protein X777_04045 [Ooceraea biroi]|uniref:Uncharacterized protein n=1 Tax=Ooceraea biroi TaxID=2015173 RepID=A0A026VV09_OOCBI|nr:hypothetical protein X777_04045 [Ooceraea biroi]